MLTRLLVVVVTLGVYVSNSPAIAQHRVAGEPEALYFEHCSSCHGRDFQGGSAKSLVNPEWLEDDALGHLTQTISEGLPQAGMPAWKDQLDAQQIRALAILVREAAHFDARDKKQAVEWDASSVFESEAHSFTLEVVGRGDSRLWAVDFLPDGSILSTQHDGKLWRFKNGKRSEIKNIPPSYNYRQGGLLDVMVHPDYEKNGWIYMTLGEKNPEHEAGSTTIVRGKISGERWTNTEYLFRVPEDERDIWSIHWGSRLLYQDGDVYFSYGDGGQKDRAQDTRDHAGKIHRIREDGSTPADNPFVREEGFIGSLKAIIFGEAPTVWSYGHRNPQGLAIHPVSNDIWSVEHGPRGGDELNRISRGTNYGWPAVSHGIGYGGDPVSPFTELPGMEGPKHFWIPSIAPGAADFYTGDKFPYWKNNLFVTGMATEELRRIVVDEGNRVVLEEVVLKDVGRVREVVDGPDGYLYIILNSGSGSLIVRLIPKTR